MRKTEVFASERVGCAKGRFSFLEEKSVDVIRYFPKRKKHPASEFDFVGCGALFDFFSYIREVKR